MRATTQSTIETSSSPEEMLRNIDGDPSVKRGPVFVLLLAIALLLSLLLIWQARVIVMLLFAAIVVAILLTAIVDWFETRLKLKRGIAFSLVLLLGTALLILMVWVTGPQVIQQFEILQTDLPVAYNHLMDEMRGYDWGRWMLAELSGYSQLSESVGYAVRSIGGMMLSSATGVGGIILVAVLGLYFAAEPNVYLAGIRRATPKRYRAILEACTTSAARTLRWWLLAQMLSMIAVGLLVWLGLWALGVPLAGTLGIIAALLTFIPNVGPILSSVPAALLGLAISPITGLLTLVLFMFVHFVEGYVITPLLQREIVRLPPAFTLLAELLLAVIAGPLGVALAAPMAASALGIFKTLVPEEKGVDLSGVSAQSGRSRHELSHRKYE